MRTTFDFRNAILSTGPFARDLIRDVRSASMSLVMNVELESRNFQEIAMNRSENSF